MHQNHRKWVVRCPRIKKKTLWYWEEGKMLNEQTERIEFGLGWVKGGRSNGSPQDNPVDRREEWRKSRHFWGGRGCQRLHAACQALDQKKGETNHERVGGPGENLYGGWGETNIRFGRGWETSWGRTIWGEAKEEQEPRSNGSKIWGGHFWLRSLYAWLWIGGGAHMTVFIKV